MDFDNERAYHSDDASQTNDVFGEDEREHAVDSEAAKWELRAVPADVDLSYDHLDDDNFAQAKKEILAVIAKCKEFIDDTTSLEGILNDFFGLQSPWMSQFTKRIKHGLRNKHAPNLELKEVYMFLELLFLCHVKLPQPQPEPVVGEAIAAAAAAPNPSHVFDDFVVPDNVRNKRKYEIYDTTAGRAYRKRCSGVLKDGSKRVACVMCLNKTKFECANCKVHLHPGNCSETFHTAEILLDVAPPPQLKRQRGTKQE
jgi:hypothetical protein